MQYPEGFPRDGLVRLQGKEYITHTGLVWLATRKGPWSSSVDLVERRWAEDGLPLYIEVHVTVTAGEVSHTAIGDASRANVGKMIATALPRMAHTRALNRALRALLGQGATTAEEIPAGQRGPSEAPQHRERSPAPDRAPEQPQRQQQQPRPQQPSQGEQVARDIVQAGKVACPNCNSRVYDNRDPANRKNPKGPLWKCSNRDCGGGRNGYPWASWRADQFGHSAEPVAELEVMRDQAAADDGIPF